MESFSAWYFRVEADKLALESIEDKFGVEAMPDRRTSKSNLVEYTGDPEEIELIESLSNPIVITRSELSEHLRDSKCRIVESQIDYLPEILLMLRESRHIEIDVVFSNKNSKRFFEQVVSINEKLATKAKFEIDFATKTEDK